LQILGAGYSQKAYLYKIKVKNERTRYLVNMKCILCISSSCLVSVSLKSQILNHAVVINKTYLGSSCYILSFKAELQLSSSEKTQIILN